MKTSQKSLKCVDGFTLKLIALLTMTIDHTAAVLGCGPLYWPMRAIGRIAFLIYCFLLVEGYFHTRNVGKYTGRLLIAFALSDIPFDLAFAYQWPSWQYQNVMLTLAIGLAAIYLADHSRSYAQRFCQSETQQKVLRALLMLAFSGVGIWLAEFCRTDYGGGGVLLILLFYLFREKPVWLCVSVLAELFVCFGLIETPGILAMIPILLYNGQRGPTPGGKWGQWFFYLYYPLHIGILVLFSIGLYGAAQYTLPW